MSLPDYLDLGPGITPGVLRQAFGDDLGITATYAGIGDNDSAHCNAILSFVSDAKYVETANANPRIAAVFCLPDVTSSLRADIAAVVVDDPKYYFFTLMDHLARHHHRAFPTAIGEGCAISPSATIAQTSVRLGRNVTVEPGAYVAPGSLIDDDVVIRANATVGVDGFQHQRTRHGTVSPLHDGWLQVGRGTEIGYSASISRGFSYRPTTLGEDVKIDALAYVAHGASVGSGSTVCTHSAIMGHANIGDRCWLGPGSIVTSRVSLGDDAKITIGSVVSTDIPAGERYTGNFAMPHEQFIRDLKTRAGRA